MTQASPLMAMNTAMPTSEYICASTVDCVPVTGSTSEPNEKPISVSSSEPADCSAANIAPSANEDARPTTISLTIRPPKPSASSSIVPCLTTGMMPTASASAM